jgi:hypothetical protein
VTERNQDAQPQLGGVTRRSMIAGSAGVATSVAVTALAPAAAAAASRSEAAPIPVPKPLTPIEKDPVVAYVHNAARGEVTVIHGEVERTYRDPALVKRLLAAAKSSSSPAKEAR